MKTIALLGAAGATGKSIAAALKSRGMAYRVVGRDRDRLVATFGDDPKAEVVTWNLDEPASVTAALQGVETAIYLIGAPYDQNQLHPILTKQVLDGAIAAQVKRIVLLGTVYPYGKPTTPTVSESHPREPKTFKGQMRKQQEELFLTAHAQGKIEATILRMPDFYGPEVGAASFLHLVFQAALKGGAADMIGPIDSPHEFLYIPDLGPVVVDLATNPKAYGRAWNLAGAGVTTQRKLAEQIFSLGGKKPKYRVLGKTGLRIMGLFSPFMREFVEMNYLQTNPVLLDDSALVGLLGTVHKTPYAEGIKQTWKALASSK